MLVSITRRSGDWTNSVSRKGIKEKGVADVAVHHSGLPFSLPDLYQSTANDCIAHPVFGLPSSSLRSFWYPSIALQTKKPVLLDGLFCLQGWSFR
jgi:hypothetical protein